MQYNKTIKLIFTSLIFCWVLISVTYGKTTQQWRDIVNQLKDDWRTNREIRQAIEDLWYDADEYLWSNTYSWDDLINNISSYTSRSCKVYNIEYNDVLQAYTSPDLNEKEYFINIDYFKRYVDSKNAQKTDCPTNKWRINTFYNDTSSRTDRYIAPNWKIYFITQQNWSYTSYELKISKNFWTINELKNHIRDRNSLIWMGQS